MALTTRGLRRLRRAAAILFTILFILFFLGSWLLVTGLITDLNLRKLPSYARIDLSDILQKPADAWTEEEERTLFLQTGVLASALKGCTPEEITAFQDALFFQGKCEHEVMFEGICYHDRLVDDEGNAVIAPIVDLEPGDILLTSSTHTVGWGHGHAAIVLEKKYLLQSFVIGSASAAVSPQASNGIPWFQQAANFLVLRLKNADPETRLAIAKDAAVTLSNVTYDLFAGVFTAKDQGKEPTSTQCSHLVWQAYKNFGYDLDFDGGPVVTPRDIAKSPLLEVVQCYGFDPLKGWE